MNAEYDNLMKDPAYLPKPIPEFGATRPSRTSYSCQQCQLFKGCKTPFMKPHKPKDWTGRYVFIGEAPGEDEDKKSHRPFTGPAGKLLRKLRKKADIARKDVYLMNAVRCRPPGNATPTMKQIRYCGGFLRHDLKEAVGPLTKIVGLGVVALKSLTNKGTGVSIVSSRGKNIHIYNSNQLYAHITYHPAAILHGALHLKQTIIDDLKLIGATKLKPPEEGLPTNSGQIAIDTEYDPDGNLLTLGAADAQHATAVEQFYNDNLSPIIDESAILIGHNLPGDIDMLLPLGFKHSSWLKGTRIKDSLLIARMIDENKERGAYGLENLACAELGIEPWKGETEAILKTTGDARNLTPLQRTQRCRMDAWASYMLAQHYTPKLPSVKLTVFNHRIEMCLHRVGLAGAAVDMELFYKLGHEWKDEAMKMADLLKREAMTSGYYAFTGEEFSPTNDNHIRVVLYNLLKLKPIKKTAKTKKPCVDRFVLAEHAEAGSQFAANLIAFNKVDKLASTWIGGSKTKRKSLAELIELGPLETKHNYGLLHFWINPLGARTGRRTSGGAAYEGTPESRNGQNWPPAARRMIVSRWEGVGGLIGAMDFRKLEPVLFAWNATDAKMLDFFLNGGGYIQVAKEVLKTDVVDGSGLYKGIKAICLGIQYYMKLYKTAQEVWKWYPLSTDWDTHVKMVKKLRRKIFHLFPGIKPYIRKQLRELAATQQVVAATGAIRHLPHDGPESEGYWHLENQAVNYPTQHLASMVTGCAMIDYEEDMLSTHGISYLDWHTTLLQKPWEVPASPIIDEIHDELLLDMHPAYGKQDLRILEKAAQDMMGLKQLIPNFDLKLNCKITTSDRWGGE